MQGVAPKGSYHSYCRSNHTAHSLQHTHRLRSVRQRPSKQPNQIEEFQDFEAYLRYLQQKEKLDSNPSRRPNTTDYRSAITSRPRTHAATRTAPINEPALPSDKNDLIKPYFPFFKCRIDSQVRTEKLESQFRLRNQKFKLNYRIIEENMGKGDSRQEILDL